MTKAMGTLRDSRALSWLSVPRTDVPAEPPLSYALLFTILDSVNPVLYPSMDTILCVLLNMPAASATAEMSFSVLRRLKTCDSSTMKNGKLSSLGLMHIHRDFEVDLYKAMEVFVSAKT
jgi:hypothetical protein